MFTNEFVLRALAGGLGVALVAGPLGVFVLWRRMAFFGAALAHSSLLGVVLGAALGLAPDLAMFAVAAMLALLLPVLQRRTGVGGDALLSIFAHGTLAAGLVLAATVPGLRVDLTGWLFGDLLAVGTADLVRIWGGGGVVAVLLAIIWRPLLAMTVHEELARVEGVRTRLVDTVFLLLVAFAVAAAVRIVGLLLVSALLVMPAAAALRLARTPEQMAALAALAGAAAVTGGLAASLALDTPAGPSVALVATLLFAASLAVPARGAA